MLWLNASTSHFMSSHSHKPESDKHLENAKLAASQGKGRAKAAEAEPGAAVIAKAAQVAEEVQSRFEEGARDLVQYAKNFAAGNGYQKTAS